MKKSSRLFFIGLFVALVWFPIAQMGFGLVKEFDNAEKRDFAPPPDLTGDALGDVPRKSDLYFSDNFGLRPNLIRWNCYLRVNLFGVSPVPHIVVGRDSWFFYRAEAVGDGYTIENFRGTVPLADSELESVRLRLEAYRQAFARRGIAYVVAVAPNKCTIHGDHLPERDEPYRHETRLDQLLAHMREHHSPVEIVDLRDTLRKASHVVPVYGKTDSHWNNYGAYIGYREIMKRLAPHQPDLRPVEVKPEDVRVESSLPGGDLAQMLYMQDIIPEDHRTHFTLPKPAAGPSGTVLFRADSFGDLIYQYLRLHFKTVDSMAPFAPYDFERIDREKPRVVLQLLAERYIPQALQDEYYYKAALRDDL